MAKVKSKRQSFPKRIERSISEGLATAGIDAEVETERVRGTRLHRVLTVARQFEHLRPSERQDLVWRIIKQHFSPEEQLRISMILTLTPDELGSE